MTEFERALRVCPPNDPCRAAAQTNLATAKFILCQVEDRDLLVPLGLYHDALAARPIGHPDRPSTLIRLAAVYLARFQKLRGEDAAAQAEVLLDEAMKLSLTDNFAKPVVLFMLKLHSGRRVGPAEQIGQSLAEQGSASRLMDEGLDDLSVYLLRRFERFGDLADLQQAVSILRKLVRSTSPWDDRYCSVLGNLGAALYYRFEHLGDEADLNEGLSRLGDASDITPDGHPHKPNNLNNLGNSFRARFERFGQLNDLEDAISRQREAVDLTPDGHPDKPSRLSNLGSSFLTRFERLGQLNDLEDGISRQREAVDLTPDGHSHKPSCLNNLGWSLLTRFERLGQLDDLEDAISRQREAADLIPDGHPHKPICLHNLCSSFRARFERLGQLNDLEDAISRQRETVDLIPDGHPDKPGYLNSLGSSFRARFERLGQLNDLEDAISRQRQAIDLTPDGHPDRSSRLNNLGISIRTRFECLGHLSDMEHAILLFFRAASDLLGSATVRFRASQNWIICARAIRHRSLLHAYSVSISILPQLAWNGLSFSARYAQLVRGADVVREAAAAALESGLLETAVEWLEQARSIVWGDLFQLRSSYDDLSLSYPGHAYKLRELSAALECASATHEKSLSALFEPTPSVTRSLQQEADSHRALAIKRDKLLQDIRRLPGFEQFLLQKDFSQLRASAHSGPVVILNAAETRCDALMILPNVDDVIHVPLPRFSLKQSAGLQNTLQGFLRQARTGRPAPLHLNWKSLLSLLWRCVVKPVLNALGFSVCDVILL